MIKYTVPNRPKILFIGINPHPGSYRRGVPFSNNKNFWYNLSRSGLIEEKLYTLKDDKYLRELYKKKFSSKYHFGFVNLVNRPTVDTSMLLRGEEKAGIRRVLRMIKEQKPEIACFIGKITYIKFSGEKSFKLGTQPKKIYSTKVFVASFPIRGPNSVRVKELKELRKLIQ
ncbi:MAG: uracil-DNA glycosylase family protein [Candidatus Micrarchaeaceae archaeon]